MQTEIYESEEDDISFEMNFEERSSEEDLEDVKIARYN